MFTKVLFTCRGCGLENAEVEVAARESTVDVAVWLRAIVGPKISATHRSLSPGCRTAHCDIKIPIEGKAFIGESD